MPLYYSLFDNPLTPDPNDRMALTQVNSSLTREDVINRMTSRGSTVTKAEALSVLEEHDLAFEELVKEGNAVTTPLFNITLGIVGVFNGDEDGFDRSRHQVKLRINPGKRLKEMEPKVPVEKIISEKKMPVLLNYHDSKTESRNEVISPDSGARITGAALKFDETDVTQGIFYVNQADGAAVRATGKLLRHKPGELIFMTPALAAGTYKVEVRSMLLAKTMRTGVLPYELTVGV